MRYFPVLLVVVLLWGCASGKHHTVNSDSTVDSDTDYSVSFMFRNNGLDYQPITTPTEFVNEEYELSFLGIAQDDRHFYIKLVYISPEETHLAVRLAGDAPGLFKLLESGTKSGTNLVVIKLDRDRVPKYPEHICVEIGDDHSVVVEKRTVDSFIDG